ncbi:MAG: hypothetical protein ACM3XO_12330 [Bacteroidota bacterium]
MIARYKPSRMDAEMIDRITGKISQELAEWYGPGARMDPCAPEIRSHRNSFMLRYSLRDSRKQQKHILVKIRRKPKMTALHEAVLADIHQYIPAEYRSLQYVYSQLPPTHKQLGAIRPLTYLDQDFAIVMEEYPSQTLRQLLNNHRSVSTGDTLDELRDAARKTGLWLRHFHDHIHIPVEMRHTAEDILQEVQEYAGRIETSSHGRVRARSILDAFATRLKNIPIERMVFSQTHTDMTCDNVLFSMDGKVGVTDIKTRPAPVYADLGMLLIHPETFKCQIFTAGTYYTDSLLHEYRSQILAGYFRGRPGHQVSVGIYTAVKVLDKWLMYEDLMKGYRSIKRLMRLPVAPLVSAYFQNLMHKHLRSFIFIAAMLDLFEEVPLYGLVNVV